MKIYVINLKRLLKRLGAATIAVAILLALGLSFRTISKATGASDGVATQAEQSSRVVVLDAGHGGEDPGAVGVNGKYEKDLNLEITLLIGELLSEKGYTVVYTRTEDKMLYSEEDNIKGMRKISDLKNRCAISAEYPECIFISIHMNTYGASKYSGLQVYYNSDDSQSRILAQAIQDNVKSKLQNHNNRAIKDGSNLYLLENCSGTGALIECGFLSNKDECEKLSQKEYQKELSFSIVCGIIEYIEDISG